MTTSPRYKLLYPSDEDACPQCNGTGRYGGATCLDCHGRGYEAIHMLYDDAQDKEEPIATSAGKPLLILRGEDSDAGRSARTILYQTGSHHSTKIIKTRKVSLWTAAERGLSGELSPGLRPHSGWESEAPAEPEPEVASDLPSPTRSSTGLVARSSHIIKTVTCYETFSTRWPVIDPHSSMWLSVWDLGLSMLLIVVALLSPYESAFLETQLDTLFVVNRIIDGFFMCDMLMQFCVAQDDPCSNLMVRDPYLIAVLYLRGWFWIDFVSCFPLDALLMLLKHTKGPEVKTLHAVAHTTKELKIFRVLRLARLLRLTRFARLAQRWHSTFGLSFKVQELARLIIVAILCSHWLACLWGAVAFHNTAELTWLSGLRTSKGGSDDLYSRPAEVYWLSMYWSIMSLTSIGYGDINPQNYFEYVMAVMCMMVMASVWAYVIGAVCQILSTLQPHEVKFRRDMDDLNWLIKERGMSKDLSNRLRKFFYEARDISREQAEKLVVDQMSPSLQGEVAYWSHSQWIVKVWYLRDLSDSVIVQVSRYMNTALYGPNEEIHTSRTLFAVTKGLAMKGRVMMKAGNVWGEDMILYNDCLRDTRTVRSFGYLKVIRLKAGDLQDIVNKVPSAKTHIRNSRVKIALCRGFVKIAKSLQVAYREPRLTKNQMSDQQRRDIVVDTLRGMFNPKKLDVYTRLQTSRYSLRMQRHRQSLMTKMSEGMPSADSMRGSGGPSVTFDMEHRASAASSVPGSELAFESSTPRGNFHCQTRNFETIGDAFDATSMFHEHFADEKHEFRGASAQVVEDLRREVSEVKEAQGEIRSTLRQILERLEMMGSSPRQSSL